MRAGRISLYIAVSVAVGLSAMGQVNIYAWEPHANDLDTAIHSGDFGGYFSKITTWLNQKAPAEPNRISEETMKAILKNPVFRNTLNQRQLISAHGVGQIQAFAQADQRNRTFLAWLLRNTEAMDLYWRVSCPPESLPGSGTVTRFPLQHWISGRRSSLPIRAPRKAST